ncbi:MAG: DUF2470 domain-containing protein [Sandaracinaceae bacterium]|nr:hypothetical protein [Myxococcales bacterium]
MTELEHGRGSGEPETPLTPPETKAPSHAERARTLVGLQKTGTLCTVARDPEGYPYGSFVTFALDGPDPVFLVSTLAAHTKNLMGDGRASLLVAEHGEGDPLAYGRVTLVGDAAKLDDPGSAREAFLAAHPNAAYYADFSDFAFWKLTVTSVRYIGGYGRMSWVDVAEWREAQPDPLAPHVEGVVTHMNDDHADALVSYARAFTRATHAEKVSMTGIDRYGFEMSVETDKGPRPARLAFASEIATPEEARKALVALVRDARAKLQAP